VSEEDKSSSSATESRLRDEGGKESEALFDFANARVINYYILKKIKDYGKSENYWRGRNRASQICQT